MRVAVVVDAFRAFATAGYVLERFPAAYYYTNRCGVIKRLSAELAFPLLIGKCEKGSQLSYDIPSSPTRVKEIEVLERSVLHRTEAGAKGVLKANGVDLILVAGFGNGAATARYIRSLGNVHVDVIPMGHEGIIPSLEDCLCAIYIQARLEGKEMKISSYYPALKKSSGRYFFLDDQWQYPEEDFERCLELERFDFPIRAEVHGDYAELFRVEC